MIHPNSIKKSQAIKLWKLIEEQTRAEVIARVVRFDNFGYIDYAKASYEKIDEIRRFIYGTDSLVELAAIFNIPLGKKKRKKKKRKKK